MLYQLEFFTIEGDERQPLDQMPQEAESIGQARQRARAAMKYVKIRDREPRLCEVKDQKGHVLSVVMR